MSNPIIIPRHTRLTTDPEASTVLAALEQDWRRLNGGIDVADPGEMDRALPYTFMLERTAPGATRLRVAGQALHAIAGMEPRGLSLTTFFSEGLRDTIAELAEAAFTLPAIIGLPLSVNRRLIRKPATASLLLLPMTPVEGRSRRVLGAIVPDELVPLKGVRFDMARSADIRCEPQVLPLSDRRAPAPHQPEAVQRLGRPALRLVVDNTR